MKILIVDDQSGMRETLIDILEEAGYEVDAAGDGYGAIEKADQQFFDVILIDIIMPGINGVDTIKEIQRANKRPGRKTEFILMTAYSAETLIEEALSCGIYQYINKPFPPEQIISLVEEIRERRTGD
ncbi:MAG: response regulator [bacterium]